MSYDTPALRQRRALRARHRRATASHNAIVDRVVFDLSWVESAAGGAPVVIVAHSQGAEVARRALTGRSRTLAPIAGLVTFGRGFSRTVVNRRSMLLDHVAYRHNIEGFQATVALEIDRAAQGDANPRRPLAPARAERARSRIICAIDGVRLAVVILVPLLWIGVAQDLWARALIAGLGIGLLVGVSKLLDLRATARTRALMARPQPVAAPAPLVAA